VVERFYRSQADAMLGGVCGGLGEFFGIEANLVRILFVIVTVFTAGFVGPFAYLLLWLVVPERGTDVQRPLAERARARVGEIGERARGIGSGVRRRGSRANQGGASALGATLIVVGIALLLRNLGIPWMRWAAVSVLWPAALILVGVAFVWRWLRGGT
jgi:phage shock protein C